MDDVPGRIDRAANPPGKPKLPQVGPAFLTQEDAAYWAHRKIPLKPDREYGSVILQRPDGGFVATVPIAGEVTRFDFGTVIEVDAKGSYVHPNGYKCVANLHCHAALHDKIREHNPKWDELLVRLFISFFLISILWLMWLHGISFPPPTSPVPTGRCSSIPPAARALSTVTTFGVGRVRPPAIRWVPMT